MTIETKIVDDIRRVAIESSIQYLDGIADDIFDKISDRVIKKLQDLEILPTQKQFDNMWGEFEEQKLSSRLDDFCEMAAKAHGRTPGAIRERVKFILHRGY